jgi:hypothetical protein
MAKQEFLDEPDTLPQEIVDWQPNHHVPALTGIGPLTRTAGAMAVGALALGVLAIGAVAIGRVAIGKARIRRLEIDQLVVRRFKRR